MPPGRVVHDHRELAAHERRGVVGDLLHLDRLQVVRRQLEVELRRQLVAGVVPPVLANGPSCPESTTRLHWSCTRLERRRRRLGVQRVRDVDVVERVEDVEPQDVVVADVRRLRSCCGRGARCRAPSRAPIACSVARTDACACGVGQTPQMRCANCQQSRGSRSFMKISKPRNMRRRVPRVGDLAVLDDARDAQVTLDAGDRVDDDLRLPPSASTALVAGVAVVPPDAGAVVVTGVAVADGAGSCSRPSALPSLGASSRRVAAAAVPSPPTPTRCAPRPTTVAAAQDAGARLRRRRRRCRARRCRASARRTA